MRNLHDIPKERAVSDNPRQYWPIGNHAEFTDYRIFGQNGTIYLTGTFDQNPRWITNTFSNWTFTGDTITYHFEYTEE